MTMCRRPCGYPAAFGIPAEAWQELPRRGEDHLRLVRLLHSCEELHADLITLAIDRLGHDRRYAIDPSGISAELGFNCTTICVLAWRPRCAGASITSTGARLSSH